MDLGDVSTDYVVATVVRQVRDRGKLIKFTAVDTLPTGRFKALLQAADAHEQVDEPES